MANKILLLLYFPEFILTIGILIIILIALFIKKNVFKQISFISILLLFISFFLVLKSQNIHFAYYNDFFKVTEFINFLKILIILGSIASISISVTFFNDLKLQRFEIPVLILFSTLGMMILISSNNLMSMYLGIELQSLSLYVLAAIQRDSYKSAESGVKYFILGALSSGILLYGCSLLYGFTGATNFSEIKLILNDLDKLNIGILFGLIFVLVGLAFKISAVPFHMWIPDVYEGSPTAITAFFAIVTKIAAIGLLYRLCLEPFGKFVDDWKQIVIFLSLSSMYLGAIAAIVQKNIKRLLAYSSIGHVGFLLIGLASSNNEGIKGFLIYMTIYLFMNIGVFTVILSLKKRDQYIESLSDLSGLSKKNPILSLCIALVMFSMAGIPPLAGFFGKFYIFIAALKADLIYLAVLGVIASVISAYYYLRIVKLMYFDESDESIQVSISSRASFILLTSILVITLFVVYPNFLINITDRVSTSYFNYN